MTVSISHPFRIMSSGVPVGTIRATDSDAALAAFVAGRSLPAEVDLRAYRVTVVPPKGRKPWRA